MFVDRHDYESISRACLQLSFLPQATARPGQLSRANVVLAAMGLPTWFFGADQNPASVELRKNHTQLAYRLKDKHKENPLARGTASILKWYANPTPGVCRACFGTG